MSVNVADLCDLLLEQPIAFNPALVPVCGGSVTAAIFLGQAKYWSRRTSDPDGWFYKDAEEWQEETALTPKVQASARGTLRALGLLEERQSDGINRRLSYRVNHERLYELLAEAADSNSTKRQLGRRPSGNLEDSVAERCIGTETTTETTTEKKARGRAGKIADIDGFEEFWALYPRRTAKAAALRAWAAAKRKKILPPLAAVLTSLRKQIDKNDDWRGCEAKFVPHASTWLNQERWADEVEAFEPERRVLNPPPSPADLAAQNLKHAVAEAEKAIPKIAPAEDGWTSKSRSVLLDHLDACKTEAEVEAHLAACRALCDRLRAMGAFPLRKPTQPGEILPAGGGGPLAVDLRTGFICDSLCPACGEDQAAGPCSCGDHDHPAISGRPKPLAIGCDRGCPVGGPCASWPEPCPAQFLSVTTVVDGDAPTLAFDLFVKTSPEGPAARIESLATASDFCPCGAPMIDDGNGGTTCIESCQYERDRQAQVRKAVRVREGRVADGQHAYVHNALSGKCVWCGQDKDHIRHYLPRELPFTVTEES